MRRASIIYGKNHLPRNHDRYSLICAYLAISSLSSGRPCIPNATCCRCFSILALLVAANTAVSGAALATDLRETALPAVAGREVPRWYLARPRRRDCRRRLRGASFSLGHGFGAQFDGIGDGNAGDFQHFFRRPSVLARSIARTVRHIRQLRWNAESLSDELVVSGAKVGQGQVEATSIWSLDARGHRRLVRLGDGLPRARRRLPHDDLRVCGRKNQLEGPGLHRLQRASNGRRRKTRACRCSPMSASMRTTTHASWPA